MIEKVLTSLVNEYAGNAIAGSSSIPNDQKNMVSQTLSDALCNGIKDQITQGNIAGILDIFSKKETSSTGNSVMSGIESTVTTILCNKTGLNKSIVQGLVSAVLPSILSALGKKAADPKDQSVDFNDIIKSVGSGNLAGLDLNAMMGRLDDDDDKFDMNDVANIVSGLSEQKGGIIGMLGGLFGK